MRSLKRKSGFVFCIAFFAYYLILDYILHPFSIEPLRNSLRLLFSTLVIVALGRYIIRLKSIFVAFAVVNSVLILLQGIDHYSAVLPEYLKAENIIHVDDYRRSFRNPGFLFGFQIASFVTVSAIEILLSYKFILRNLLLLIMFTSLLLGSRIVLLAYVLYNAMLRTRYTVKFLAFTLIGFAILFTLIPLPDVVHDYLNLRFGFLGGLAQGTLEDYSAEDTISFYGRLNDVSLINWVIGNGYPQYSKYGGNDPLYLRYLLQSGFISLILIMLSVIYLIFASDYSLKFKFVLTFLFLFTSVKGELFTGLFSFELLVIFLLYGEQSNLFNPE